MPVYLVVVKVEPPGTELRLADPKQPLRLTHQEGGKRASIVFLTEKRDVIVVLFDSNWDAPLSEVRVLVTHYVQRLYAVVSLLANHFMQIFVLSVTNTTTGDHEAFRESWPILDSDESAKATQPEQINAIFQLGLTNALLSVAIEDVRLATGHLWSGPFFCYRAIESVRQHFRIPEDPNRSPSWDRMRAALRLDESYTRFLWNASNPVRHGDVIRIDIGLSIECLSHARNIIFRFMEYLLHGSLNEDRFPLLRTGKLVD